ncbi:MAG: 5'/3'-nucleotidase SurE [Treponema sp.]|jgi:5'-nucleotidase|nr:5'/3'-nucleotidase SurE [Treponema sp.]
MTILMTNDDGINSPGLLPLAHALRKAGHRVFVLAPEDNRSGVSHCISFLNGPVRLTNNGEDTWSCPGNPVDCVVLALLGGLPEMGGVPDLVLSGINQGANIGTDIVYSGTAAAARQGSLIGIPSVALSLIENQEYYWDMAVSFSVKRLEELKALWRPGTFVNVNIPNTPDGPLGLASAFPALRDYQDTLSLYEAHDGRRYCFVKPGEVTTRPEAGSDWDVVSRNMASVSAIYIHPVTREGA